MIFFGIANEKDCLSSRIMIQFRDIRNGIEKLFISA